MITDPIIKARWLELADFIEKARFEFDMELDTAMLRKTDTKNVCGTAGCIAGHAAVLWPEVRGQVFQLYDTTRFRWHTPTLMRFLGLDVNDYSAMFYNDYSPADEDRLDLSEITRPMAVAAIRRYVETGKIEFRLEDDPMNLCGDV